MMFQHSTQIILLLSITATFIDAFRNNGGNTMAATKEIPVVEKVTDIPMPFNWPIVGTLPDFLKRGGLDRMADVHETMYQDYGPVYKMSLLGDDEMIFSDPRIFDQILRNEGKFPIGGAESITSFKEYYQENNMDYAIKSLSRGPEWKAWRQSANADMYVMWDTYLPAIADTCAQISKVAGKEVMSNKLHITDFLSRAAFDMFSAVVYGESPQTTDSAKAKREDLDFVVSTKKAFDITGQLISNPLEKKFGGDLYKNFVTHMDKTMIFASKRGMEKIKDAKNMLIETNNNDNKADDESGEASSCPISAIKKGLNIDNKNPSYIERLVNRGDLTEDQINEVQSPLLMAGVDTTAYAMSWFYLAMASNPEIQNKLAKELKEKLNGKDVTTVEQMESLTYLKQCFRESHRLTPVSPINIKTLEKDIDVVVDNKQYQIPSGQRISLNLRALPLDPEYVDNPKEYIPERFSQEAIEARKGTMPELALDHPYMNDPFGRGKRKCLGANVAIAEMTVLAARLLQDWEISLVNPSEAIQSPTKLWSAKQKLMLVADPYPAMELTPRK